MMANAEGRAKALTQRERIEKLKARAQELTNGEFRSFSTEACPLDVQEAFWRRVVECAESPLTTHAKVLEKSGFVLTPPDQLSDEELTRKLWQLIVRLAEMNCYLSHTDHLSDRELYEQLVEETLQEEVEEALLRPQPGACYHYDLIGSGSEEDIQIMLRFYSTKEEREQWHLDFPDDLIPPMSMAPYNRDRLLPKWEQRLAG
jgi:hypothetical protein